jgi:hypothetical protein
MVYIKSETIKIGNKSYKLVTKYFVRSKSFVIDLPDIMQETLGKKWISADTQDELETEWYKVFKEYKNALEMREKVIVYDFQATAIIWNEDHTRVIFRENEISFLEGTGLSLNWYVGYRVNDPIADEIKFLYLNGNYADRDRSSDRERIKYMKWTEAREQFFKELQFGLESMILRAYEFFNKTDNIPALIDSGMMLLPKMENQEE